MKCLLTGFQIFFALMSFKWPDLKVRTVYTEEHPNYSIKTLELYRQNNEKFITRAGSDDYVIECNKMTIKQKDNKPNTKTGVFFNDLPKISKNDTIVEFIHQEIQQPELISPLKSPPQFSHC